jgi:pimeloyl-ACP methyl ester carboxylesterase
LVIVPIGSLTALTLAGFTGLVLLSYGVEALRPRPNTPASLFWGAGVAIGYANLGGIKIRYLKAGSGPNLVLLHTLRTQFEIFQKVIPALAEHFTVYAYDYPGHGWSDIPTAAYAPEDFYRWTAAFLDSLDIREASLAGISIGGTISLVLAARQNPRIKRVVAINPYDYPPAGGIRKSSLAARLILGPAGVPILGSTLMRLRNRLVSDAIMEGGVADPDALSGDLKKELYDVGARRGHYQAFLNLLAHERLWFEARSEYPRISIPTLLVYGEHDWAPKALRQRNQTLLPGATLTTLEGGGHFLSLDQPDTLTRAIIQFVTNAPVSGGTNA